jgi:hypothetical protein
MKSNCCHKGKNPKECTPEQIAECHPEAKGGHPCEEEADDAEEESS